MPNYQQTITERLIEVLKENLGSYGFKQFYNGDPEEIPQSYLPCLCVVKRRTEWLPSPTGTDKRQHLIFIRAVYNKKDEFGKSASEAVLQKTLENLMEGIDDTTGEYAQTSVIGILRKNFTLGNFVVNNQVSVDYANNPDRPGLFTFEAQAEALFDDFLTVHPKA